MAAVKKVLTEDGVDVTEAVQILYDIAHSSMDWSSGFLDYDEMHSVISLAITMGMKVPDLSYASEATQSLIHAFPDHYEVVTTEVPERIGKRPDGSTYAIPATTLTRLRVKEV